MRLQFEEFTFDGGTRQLRRNGAPVRLSGKAFALLQALLARQPDVVTKQALMQQVWPDTFVTEANLSVYIAEIRRALDDQARQPRFIRTDSGSGYAFFAEVVDLGSRRNGASARPSNRCWLDWNGQRLRLNEGDNIIGRHPECDVWIDEPRVSKHHARIVIAGDVATLQDEESKNGTFVQGLRVESPRRLSNGDVIRLCTTELTFRVAQAQTATVKHVT